MRGKGNLGAGKVAASPVQGLGHCFQQLAGAERLGQGDGWLKRLVLRMWRVFCLSSRMLFFGRQPNLGRF